MSQILFEDHIGISSLNDAGKKFERGMLHFDERYAEREFGFVTVDGNAQ